MAVCANYYALFYFIQYTLLAISPPLDVSHTKVFSGAVFIRFWNIKYIQNLLLWIKFTQQKY